jgi:hypothetical protein
MNSKLLDLYDTFQYVAKNIEGCLNIFCFHIWYIARFGLFFLQMIASSQNWKIKKHRWALLSVGFWGKFFAWTWNECVGYSWRPSCTSSLHSFINFILHSNYLTALHGFIISNDFVWSGHKAKAMVQWAACLLLLAMDLGLHECLADDVNSPITLEGAVLCCSVFFLIAMNFHLTHWWCQIIILLKNVSLNLFIR